MKIIVFIFDFLHLCQKIHIIKIKIKYSIYGEKVKIRNELNYCLFLQKTNDIHRKPVNEEMVQYLDICKGDMETVRQRIEKMSDLPQRQLSEDPVRNARYHLVIDASAISKACIQNGMGHDEAYTLADIYIRKADKCKSYNGVIKLMQEMQLDFAERMQEIKKQHVISIHVRKCIDYIYEHLGEDLRVNNLAAYCDLNSSYLSKLFYSETGIHLKTFVLDAKVDTAKNLLKYSNLSYLDISVSLGFSSQSSFISNFRKVTGTTPKKYRSEHYISEQ